MTMPAASQVRVELCGAGPGTYLDFATLSFQVPTNGLSWASSTLPAVRTRMTRAKIRSVPLFRRFIPQSPLQIENVRATELACDCNSKVENESKPRAQRSQGGACGASAPLSAGARVAYHLSR